MTANFATLRTTLTQFTGPLTRAASTFPAKFLNPGRTADGFEKQSTGPSGNSIANGLFAPAILATGSFGSISEKIAPLIANIPPEYLAAGGAAIASAGVIAVIEATRPKSTQPLTVWQRLGAWTLATTAVALPTAVTFAGLYSGSFTDPWNTILPIAAWGAALTLGGFYVHAVSRNNLWAKSESAADIAQIEKAREEKNVSVLDAIGNRARARYQQLTALIEEARGRGENKIANGPKDTVAAAERKVAFDKLVAARADLNENPLSTDPTSRIGGELLETWQAALPPQEGEAKASGFEGHLAVFLRNMNGKLQQQEGTATTIDTHIGEFETHVPKLFGGEMSYQAKTARGELETFKTGEVGQERALWSQYNTAMRGRVSDRLYSEREDYRQHFDRLQRLNELLSKLLGPTAKTARYIDGQLADMISNRQSETMNLALAAANTRVPVPGTDSNGKPTVRYVDNSGPYRAMAASAAAAAQKNAENARRALNDLRQQIAMLHRDPVIAAEGLLDWLPHGAPDGVGGGQGGMTDWFLPPLFSLFGSMASQNDAGNARNGFAPVLDALIRTEHEIDSRRDGEDRWVNAEIDADLLNQIARAENGQG